MDKDAVAITAQVHPTVIPFSAILPCKGRGPLLLQHTLSWWWHRQCYYYHYLIWFRLPEVFARFVYSMNHSFIPIFDDQYYHNYIYNTLITNWVIRTRNMLWLTFLTWGKWPSPCDTTLALLRQITFNVKTWHTSYSFYCVLFTLLGVQYTNPSPVT